MSLTKKEVDNLRSAMKVVQDNFSTKLEKEKSDAFAEQQVRILCFFARTA